MLHTDDTGLGLVAEFNRLVVVTCHCDSVVAYQLVFFFICLQHTKKLRNW